MRIDSAELHAALKVIDLVPNQAGIDSSQFIRVTLLDDGILYMALSGGSIAEAAVATKEPNGTFTIHVDRRVISAFMTGVIGKHHRSTEVTQREDGALVMRVGRQRVNLADSQVTSNYEQWLPPEEETAVVTTDADWTKYLQALCQYVPATVSVEHLAAIYSVKGYGLLATDSLSLAAYLDPTTPQTLPFPAPIAKLALGRPIVADGKGAGIQYPCGYVYQSVSSECRTKFPVDLIKKLVKGTLDAQPHMTVEARVLQDAVAYMKSFIFGTDPGAVIHVKGLEGGNAVNLSLGVTQGDARRQIACTLHAPVDSKWRVAKLLPWLNAVDPASTVTYAQIDKNDTYKEVNAAGETPWVLLIVGVT